MQIKTTSCLVLQKSNHLTSAITIAKMSLQRATQVLERLREIVSLCKHYFQQMLSLRNLFVEERLSRAMRRHCLKVGGPPSKPNRFALTDSVPVP